MAERNGDNRSKTSRLNTPRGSAGSSRQREHTSNVRGRYASLDSSSVSGTWAQRAAEARRANEERAKKSGRSSVYEQRAREARNRQFPGDAQSRERSASHVREEREGHVERPHRYETPAERPREYGDRERTDVYTRRMTSDDRTQRVRASVDYTPTDPADRLFRHDDPYHQERRTYRSDRRTVQLGSRPPLEYEQEYDDERAASPDSDFQDDFGSEPADEQNADRGEDAGIVGRVRGVLVGMAGFVKTIPPWIRIAVVAAIAVAIIAFGVRGCLSGSAQGAKPATSSSATASSASSSASSASSSSSAQSGGVEDRWTSSGVFTTGDATLDRYVKEFCDGESDSEASASENAYRAYIAVAWSDYVERDNNQNPQGRDWSITYAKQWFEGERSGNCYEFTAVTQYVLQYFGYSDAKAEPCLVERESGDWGDHGLVFVTDITDGQKRICDDALGTNGWMLEEDALNYKIVDIGQNS